MTPERLQELREINKAEVWSSRSHLSKSQVFELLQEVERLRDKLTLEEKETSRLKSEIAGLCAEVEELDAENNRLQEEVERLQGAVDEWKPKSREMPRTPNDTAG